jgi:hypothetical protein
LFARERFAQADKNLGARFRGRDIPEFRFRFAAQCSGDVFWRMNLQRKFLLRVEELDQQRESLALRKVAEDWLSILGPKLVQSFAFELSVAHNALRFRAIDDFPRFADALIARQFLAERGFKPAAAPYSFHENGLEGEGSSSRGHRSEVRFRRM